MNKLVSCLGVIMLAALTACSGGGGDVTGGGTGGGGNGGGGSSNVIASFTADNPTPSAKTVSMQQGSQSGSHVTVEIKVTNTSNVFGASFDILYDDSMATFTGWGRGTFFESGGHAPNYQVLEASAGRIVVGITRLGNVGTASTSGTETVVKLTFGLTKVGSAGVEVEHASLLDGSVQPQPISGITWSEGTLSGV